MPELHQQQQLRRRRKEQRRLGRRSHATDQRDVVGVSGSIGGESAVARIGLLRGSGFPEIDELELGDDASLRRPPSARGSLLRCPA